MFFLLLFFVDICLSSTKDFIGPNRNQEEFGDELEEGLPWQRNKAG